MYDDIVIAPANMLGRNRQTSINEMGPLLGSDTAAVTPNMIDNDTDSPSRTVNIADSVERNLDYNNDGQLTLNERSLIGKKSGTVTTSVYDQTAIRTFNENNNFKAMQLEQRIYVESSYNNVAMPFTQIGQIIPPITDNLGMV
jgi:hypothetical protein